MNVSFDLDGTITQYPKIFVEFGKALRAAGHKVYILTGNRMETLKGDRLKKYKILDNKDEWYDEAITFDRSLPEEQALVSQVSARAAVGVFKRRMAEEFEIDVHFDDDVNNVRTNDSVPVFGVS